MLWGILKIAAAIIILLYGLLCLYMGFTRQGGSLAQLNMILVPAVMAIAIFNSDRFHAFYMDNWDACMMFAMSIFVGSGLLASFGDWEFLPGVINGVGLILLALGLSGILSLETFTMLVEFIGKGCCIIYAPLFVIALVLVIFFR